MLRKNQKQFWKKRFTELPEALELDGVVINGYNSGQAKALNAQKNKQNITNVVSTDQIGKFPDANIGDAIKRIPGITMQVDQGEARNIIVRGLAPQLNSVTLNGSRIPSAEGDNRNIQMDLIPSDMIQTIEVNKALEKGYKLINIYEIEHFENTKIGLFEEYVNLLIKYKLEA